MSRNDLSIRNFFCPANPKMIPIIFNKSPKSPAQHRLLIPFNPLALFLRFASPTPAGCSIV
ncbi:hypothetical protein AAGQ96_18110 [Pantoea sp. MBD-2R]|uniref:hypothetical protein n=1 Tax=Pantoea sp. MBD-2R TaxID=3141540 RepID=UPI003182FB1C